MIAIQSESLDQNISIASYVLFEVEPLNWSLLTEVIGLEPFDWNRWIEVFGSKPLHWSLWTKSFRMSISVVTVQSGLLNSTL